MKGKQGVKASNQISIRYCRSFKEKKKHHWNWRKKSLMGIDHSGRQRHAQAGLIFQILGRAKPRKKNGLIFSGSVLECLPGRTSVFLRGPGVHTIFRP